MWFFALSEKGRREKIEDAYLAEMIGGRYLFAVADGLGGQALGDIASRIAIMELKEMLKRSSGTIEEILEKAFEKANEEIYFQNRELRKNMGTTLVASIVEYDGRCVIANVGDSRAYLFNDGIWHTRDHKLVQELLDAGIISGDDAFNNPQKHILTRALGIERKVEPDFYNVNIKNKTLLLCSDGLYDYVTNEKIENIIKMYEHDLEKACKMLVRAALKSGSSDNITVVIVKL